MGYWLLRVMVMGYRLLVIEVNGYGLFFFIETLFCSDERLGIKKGGSVSRP